MLTKLKRALSPLLVDASKAGSVSPQKAKKLKLLSSYATSSPFPDYPHPTQEEAREVHALLSEAHPAVGRRTGPKESNNSAQTCGKVPNVIESLIGTVLSQNTNSRNSTGAKRSLDEVFGRNNFKAIATAPRDEVVEALRHGGLANRKAAIIQNLLNEVKNRHGDYSLQHLAAPNVTDEEVMEELVSYDGVGPKTAACVLAFCLDRDAFAVDTHVFRLSKLLGWVPSRSAGVDRVRAQAHLELCIPPEIKYGLHCLMVHHGRACSGCGPQGRSTNSPCVLKKYLLTKRGVKEEDMNDRTEEAIKQEIKEEHNTNEPGSYLDSVDDEKVKAEPGVDGRLSEADQSKPVKRTRRKQYH